MPREQKNDRESQPHIPTPLPKQATHHPKTMICFGGLQVSRDDLWGGQIHVAITFKTILP